MTDGIILSYFNEQKGFIPVLYSSSINEGSLIKEIVFRSTLNLIGGAKNISEERESIIDFPDHQLIGCSYLRSVESSIIRGGLMPIILILFTSNANRIHLYFNLLQIMEDMKDLMTKILPYWKNTKFSNIDSLKNLLFEFKSQFGNTISRSTSDTLETQSNKFIIKCPECSQEITVLVPRQIPDLLTIPIANAPCKHNFEAYFTKGPEFRGTSKAKSGSDTDNGLRSIFNNL